MYRVRQLQRAMGRAILRGRDQDVAVDGRNFQAQSRRQYLHVAVLKCGLVGLKWFDQKLGDRQLARYRNECSTIERGEERTQRVLICG